MLMKNLENLPIDESLFHEIRKIVQDKVFNEIFNANFDEKSEHLDFKKLENLEQLDSVFNVQKLQRLFLSSVNFYKNLGLNPTLLTPPPFDHLHASHKQETSPRSKEMSRDPLQGPSESR